MNIVKLMQGSAEWHEHRRTHRNASETPVVLGVSPWLTPYQLWQHKLGLTEPVVTPTMLRGTELEPAARAAYEARTGLVMQPLVLVDGEYSASLDGLTLGGDRLVEIKCPFKGRDSSLWKTAEAGRLPEHYQWQLQHQLMVTRATVADVFVFDGTDGIQLEITPDTTTWPQIHTAWDAFMRCVTDAQAPPLTARDTRVRDDPEWLSAAAAYLELRAAHDELSTKFDEAKWRLVDLSEHAKEQGGGVTVTRYWKAGAIDYKRIPELKTVELDRFRSQSRCEVRVSVVS
jgi:putative phage-type endonuclease